MWVGKFNVVKVLLLQTELQIHQNPIQNLCRILLQEIDKLILKGKATWGATILKNLYYLVSRRTYYKNITDT
jgi:hypothetical protein